MTAIEGTIVTTAMPTIVGSLHGMEIMNWVFSIYLLTNAMLTPIYGKLADKVGRKPIFIFGTLLFIIGSLFCGLSQSMIGLIAARAIQGMGAGAMMPVALTIIGDLYSIEKRAKVLGLNSSAWGLPVFLDRLREDSSLKRSAGTGSFYQCADRNSINYFDLAIFK